MATVTDGHSGKKKSIRGKGRRKDLPVEAFSTYDEARTDRRSIRYMQGLRGRPKQREILSVLQGPG
jgi:hypothetical protein